MAIECIIELFTQKELYPEIYLQLYFIWENCQCIMSTLTSLDMKKVPLACSVLNLIEDLRAYLEAGSTKASFGRETDVLYAKLPTEQKRK